MSCEICHARKEKRFCPAIHGRICPVCCGTEREVSLDCPLDCPYLQQAHANERPRSVQDIDPALLFTKVDITDQFMYQREPLIVGLSYGLAKAARADRSITDRDAIAALSSLAKSLETRVESGLLYEERTPSLPQQAITNELQSMIEEYRKLESQQLGYSSLHDSDLLKAVVFMLRIALAWTNGRPKARSYLAKLFTQFPAKDGVVAPEGGSSLIVP